MVNSDLAEIPAERFKHFLEIVCVCVCMNGTRGSGYLQERLEIIEINEQGITIPFGYQTALQRIP